MRLAMGAGVYFLSAIYGLVYELLERHQVAFELGEDIDSADRVSAVHTRVQIGDQSDGCITHFELTGQHRLRVSGHVDQVEPLIREPSAFGAGGKPWPLDHDHRAA